MSSSYTPQQDAALAQANSGSSGSDAMDYSDDFGAEDQATPVDRPPRVHHLGRNDALRYAEVPPVAAPKHPVLRLPQEPKSLNGNRLTPATVRRDRDMLKSRKSR